ncbi:PREDICTED: synergin gamma isoform X2 [Nanorana parkeri]|uniref:synergin gamma isoform X2 n=1 Tax=Nanorana parkeri TaxID=125878 RepID=UPI0008547CAE|nr:PREDICTED: synergin gamma isoform X2 [Nanorana parkeri]
MAMRPGAGGAGSGSFVFPIVTSIGSSRGMIPVQQQTARFPMVPVMQTNVQNMMAVGYSPQIPQGAMAIQGGLSMGPMQATPITYMGQTGYLGMAPAASAYTADMQKQYVEEQQKRFEQQQKMLEEERKRRQFQEQKQKLRLLSSVKPKTAEKNRDDALEAIKGNLDGFSRDAKMHPTPIMHARKPVGVRMFSNETADSMLPSWIYNESLVPDLYKGILETTVTPSGIDTAKLYPILLSSGLPREALGQIWAKANQTTPGKLTKEELYIVLAMIGIVQRGDCSLNMDMLNQFSSAPIPTFSSFPGSFSSAVDPLHGVSPRPPVSKPLDVSQPVVTMKSTPAATGNVTMQTFMPSTFTQPLFKPEDDDFQDFQEASKSGPSDDSFSDFQSDTSKMSSSLLKSSAPPLLMPMSGTQAVALPVVDKYAVFKTFGVDRKLESTSQFIGDGFADFKSSSADDGFTDFKTADSISPLDTPLRETQTSLGFNIGPTQTQTQKSPTPLKSSSDLSFSAVTSNAFPKTFHAPKPVSFPVAANPLASSSSSLSLPLSSSSSSSYVPVSAVPAKSSSLFDDFGDFTLFGGPVNATSAGNHSDFTDFLTSNSSATEQKTGDKYEAFKQDSSTIDPVRSTGSNQNLQTTSLASSNKYDLFEHLSLDSSCTGYDESKDAAGLPKDSDFTFQYDKFTTAESNSEKSFVDKFAALKQTKEDSVSIKSLDLPSIGGSSFGKDDSEDALSIQFDMKLSDLGGELKHGMSDSSLDLPTVSGQHPPAADDFKGTNDHSSLLSSLTISDWSEKDTAQVDKKQTDFFFSTEYSAGSSTSVFSKKETSFGSTENLTMTTISKITTFSNDIHAPDDNLAFSASPKAHVEKASDMFSSGLEDISSISLGHSEENHELSSSSVALEVKNIDDFGEFQREKPKISKFDFLLANAQGKMKSSEEMIKTELETLDLCAQGSHKRSLSLGDKEITRTPPAAEPAFRDRSHTVTEKPALPVIRDKYKDLTGEVEESERYAYEWQRCLESALQVVKKANDALNGISSSAVCTEVIRSAHGMEYLLGVIEVYRVTKRVELGIKSTAVCSEKLQNLLKDIDKLWNNLIGFMSLASLMPDESALDFASCMLRPGIKNAHELACGVCLLNVDSRSKAFNSDNDHFKLSYGGHQYHASCANFWINCVEPKPPGLILPDLL